jgi:hypothetical protein
VGRARPVRSRTACDWNTMIEKCVRAAGPQGLCEREARGPTARAGQEGARAAPVDEVRRSPDSRSRIAHRDVSDASLRRRMR